MNKEEFTLLYKNLKTIMRDSLVVLLFTAIVGGGLYPLIITGIAQVAFPFTANGSVIEVNGVKYGSELLAQQFSPVNDLEGKYLWGRAMNISVFPVAGEDGADLMYGGPANLSPVSGDYEKLVKERVQQIRSVEAASANKNPVPQELVTVSGSGLDPHISPDAAAYQVQRISETRHMPASDVQKIINKYTEGRFLGVFGEPAVNVLKVNLALDGILK